MQATPKADMPMKGSAVGRIAFLIVVGAMLAGCDKCGNWWSPLRGEAQSEPQVCREQPPQPQ
jgi:hypothetical protein